MSRWFGTASRAAVALVLAGSLGLLTPQSARAQRDLKDIPPPDPELERQTFELAEGFEVNLFAADPMLAKPIQMSFDERGRLWVATSEVYPHILPGQQARDKILILDDTDHDGRADKTTVFADGLLIPTGVAPGDGGAYVANSTELLHLADTDGDDRADQRRILLSGFGTEDTHHILHTFRWGPDGQLYFNQSIYIHSHIETPHGVRRLGGGGIWMLRPETLEMEVFIRGLVNPWGHHWDRWGQSFVTDGAGGDGINFAFPGATYFTAPGAQRIIRGLNPGSPKHCGLEVICGRHLPPEWQGNLITNDFRAHRVCRFVLSEDGSGFASQEQSELIKSTHVAFRPVDVKQGPDGAIYIADWYNPIIQHGEVDFRDPRRDHTHGRIWRVTARGRPLVPRPALADASTAQLIEMLKAPEGWTRLHAKRVLKSRGAEVVPELASWLSGLDPQDPRYEHNRLEGLWTYQALNVVEPALLLAALDAQDPRARAAAVRVAGQWHTRVDDLEPKLATLARDEHPRVRLEAVCALSRFSNAAAADAALAALDQPQDRFLDYALWQTARDLAPYWLPKVQAGEFDFGGNAEHLRFALEAVASPEAVKSLVTLLRENRLKPEGEASAVGVIARAGGPAELGLTLGQTVLAEELADGRRARMLDLLVEASRQRRTRPEGDLERIVPLLDSQEGALQLAAVRAVGSWRIEAARAALLKLIEGDSTSDPLRGAALESLADLGGDPSRDSLQAIIEGTAPLMLRLAAVAAFARLDLKQAVTQAVKLLAETDPQQANPSDLFRTLLQRKQGPETLMAALLGAKLPPDVARIGIRMARLQGQKHDLLVAALQQAGGLTSQPRVLSPEELASMLEMVAHQGDPARGEAIFRRRDMGCFKCHAIGGAGGVVGPDLSTIGSSAQPDYLIESMLNPAAKIKENYHAVVVSTDDGRVFSGIKVRQTDQELVLRDAEDRQVSIALDSIDEQAPAGSLMPVGLIEPLTTPELVDLVRFLSELGKVGPYAVGTAPLARRWETMLATDEAQFRLRRTSFASAAREEEPFVWEPAYSTTSGELPLAELPVLRPRPDSPRVGFARCELQVTTPGRVALELTSPPGLSLWVDGEPVTVQRRIELELEPGRHALTFAVDLDQSQTVQGQSQQGQSEQGQSQQEPGVQAESVQGLATLRCQLAPVEGSRAQVQWVLGK